jgi:hypothetical protein
LLGNLTGGEPILSIAFVVLLVAGVLFGLRRARRQTCLLLLWAALPGVLIIFFLRHRGTFFAIRYVLFALPPLSILLGAGLYGAHRARRRIARRMSVAASTALNVLMIVALIGLFTLAWNAAVDYVSASNGDWRAAGQVLRENVRAGDIVVAPQRTDLVYFYAHDLPGEIRASTIPFDLPRVLEQGQRLWLVLSTYIYPRDAYPLWVSLRPYTEFHIDDTIQVYRIERIVP